MIGRMAGMLEVEQVKLQATHAMAEALSASWDARPYVGQVAFEDAAACLDALIARPDLLVRLAAASGALVEAEPWQKEGHGLGCWYRSGGPCDCSARSRTYYQATAGR